MSAICIFNHTAKKEGLNMMGVLATFSFGLMFFMGWIGIGEKFFFVHSIIPLWYNIIGVILSAIPLILWIYMESKRPEPHNTAGIGAGWPGHYDDW